MWSSYIENKYSKELHHVIANTRGASTTWKEMVSIRKLVEHEILWMVECRDSSFVYENWKSLGALYYWLPDVLEDEEINI